MKMGPSRMSPIAKPTPLPKDLARSNSTMIRMMKFWVYADSCGLKTAFLGNGGRKAATIFSLRYSSSR